MRLLKFILIIILATSATTGYYIYNKIKPCDSPITYSIGAFDTKFGISKKDFQDDLQIAANKWSDSIGKNLFLATSTDGSLIINLKYDDRQQLTQKNSLLKADVDKTNKLADSIKKQFLALKDRYNVLNTEYINELATFNINQSNFNAEVDYWNKAGGAPKNEFDKLNQEKNNLTAEYNALDAKRVELNNLSNQINEFINKYNLLVKDANSTITTINKSAGKEFSEGTYDPNTNQIDIYQFDGKQKLIRVLTHELGHALGLDHNDNPLSIMYALNEANNEVLSKEDIQSLKVKCEIQ